MTRIAYSIERLSFDDCDGLDLKVFLRLDDLLWLALLVVMTR